VLREKVALRRLKARDEQGRDPVLPGAPGELPESVPEGPEPGRGQKRNLSEGRASPSKRPALQ
jgi:hypothetical protein